MSDITRFGKGSSNHNLSEMPVHSFSTAFHGVVETTITLSMRRKTVYLAVSVRTTLQEGGIKSAQFFPSNISICTRQALPQHNMYKLVSKAFGFQFNL